MKRVTHFVYNSLFGALLYYNISSLTKMARGSLLPGLHVSALTAARDCTVRRNDDSSIRFLATSRAAVSL